MTTTTNTTTRITTVRTARGAASPTTRRIHLVDIENLCGLQRPSLDDVQRLWSLYLQQVNPGPADQIVVACNHGAALNVWCGWRGIRLVLRSGVNGADEALLEILHEENVPARFDGVVIASGDGIFTDDARLLCYDDVSVQVVSRPSALSRTLRMAAQSVVELVGFEPALAA